MTTGSLLPLALLGAAAATLPTAPQRRSTALGVLALAFGLSSAAIVRANNLAPSSSDSITLAIDAGLAVAGLLLIAWSAIRAGQVERRARAAAVLLIAIVMLLGWQARRVILPAGPAAIGAAIAILLAGAAFVALVRLGDARLARRSASRPATAERAWPGSRNRGLLAGLGAALAIAGPNGWLVVCGALLAAGAASLPLLVIAAMGLLPSLWFMWTVAGPVGLGMGTLATIPLSAAAEPPLAAALAVGAFALFGIWPLRRWGVPLLVPVGVAVLLRLGAAVPAGLQSWETLLVPLGVVALLHALVTADSSEAIAGGAWLAAATGGGAGAIALAAGVALHAVASRTARTRPAVAAAVGPLAWGIIAPGGTLALQSLLGAQVVYAVLSVAAVAGLLARSERSPA